MQIRAADAELPWRANYRVSGLVQWQLWKYFDNCHLQPFAPDFTGHGGLRGHVHDHLQLKRQHSEADIALACLRSSCIDLGGPKSKKQKRGFP